MDAATSRARDVTRLLAAYDGGDADALDRALPLVYDELHALARRAFGGRGAGHTLQPTALVHEAWMRLAGGGRGFADRHHFLAVAATAMRRLLANHARDRRRLKRGGGAVAVTLVDPAAEGCLGDVDVVALDDSLRRLQELNERHAKVVEMRVFGEMTIGEVAQVLGVSERTVSGDWVGARAWLQRELLAG